MREHVYFCVSAVIVTEAAPFSWWVGGPMPGQVQLHWGGALPGGRQCACGTQGNCLDHHHYCNCDADYDQWWWYFFVHLSSVVQNLHIKTDTVILEKQQWVAQTSWSWKSTHTLYICHLLPSQKVYAKTLYDATKGTDACAIAPPSRSQHSQQVFIPPSTQPPFQIFSYSF